MTQLVTRFAPSPTGFLHIGGARTALFNWLFTRRHGGKFLLRIEDTDRARSTQEAIDAILDGLRWLGIDWDGDPIFQFARAARHAEAVAQLLARGQAYRCYCTQEELEQMRQLARAKGQPMRYDGRWRERDPSEAPAGIKPVIRLKAPQQGETVVDDLVQGTVTVANAQLDDMVLLRGDGTPTYMLAVVVDDHDMDITHVIRGDDHLNNTFRQIQLYRALDWAVPRFAHIPLIHGPDGAKLSKRHGALGVDAYRDLGFLPEAMRNYLLRLGWGHGDDEIISTEQAKAWFDLEHVGRSPSRFDMAKLTNLNAHYMRLADNDALMTAIAPRIEKALGHGLDTNMRARIVRGLNGAKQRARTLVELADGMKFYAHNGPIDAVDEKAAAILTSEAKATLARYRDQALGQAAMWDQQTLEEGAKAFTTALGLKLVAIAQPVRVALTGSTVSPGIFEVMEILGKDETLARLDGAISR